MLAEVSLNMPVFSTVLLLTAGILLGYALWYPFRSDSESIRRQLQEMAEQNDDLNKSLRQQRDAYGNLERKHADQFHELSALRESSQRVEQALRDQDTSRGELSTTIRSLEEARTAAVKQADEERRARGETEEELREARHQFANELDLERKLRQDAQAVLAAIEQAGEHSDEALAFERNERLNVAARLRETQDQLAQLTAAQANLQQVEAEVESLQRGLRDAHAARDAAQTEMEKLRQVSHEKSVELQAAHQEILEREANDQELRTALQDVQIMAQQLRQERDGIYARHEALTRQHQELTQEKDRIEQSFDALGGVRQTLAETIEDQRRALIQLQEELHHQALTQETNAVVSQDLAAARQQLQDAQHGLELTRAQCQRLVVERDEALATAEAAQLTASALEEDLGHHQRALETVTRQHEKSRREANALEHEQSELLRAVNDHEHTIETLRLELAELNVLRQQSVAVQAALKEQTHELKALRVDRDEVAQRLAAEQTHAESLRDQMTRIEKELDQVRAQREEVLEHLQGEKTKSHELALSLSEQARRLEQIHEKLATLEPLRNQLAELHRVNEQLDVEIISVSSQRDAAQAAATQLSGLLDQLRQQLADSHQAMVSLERNRDPLLSSQGRQTGERERTLDEIRSMHDAESLVENRTLHNRAAELSEIEERRGLIYPPPPLLRDDLKLINGIARVDEQSLNQLGVYTYQQIMNWDATAVTEFARLLSSHEGVRLDEWVEQARRLFEDGHDRAA